MLKRSRITKVPKLYALVQAYLVVAPYLAAFFEYLPARVAAEPPKPQSPKPLKLTP